MKTIKLIIFSLFLLIPVTSEAKGFILFWGNSQKVSEVYTLPNEEYFQTEDGKHLNLGVIYEVFKIFGIPLLITEDPSFVYAVEGEDDTFYDIDTDTVKSIAEEYNINDIESLKKATFWDAWGGKILILVLILLFVLVSMSSGNTTEEATGEKEDN